METRDTVFLVVMVLSSFLLSFEWLRRFTYKPTNPFIDPLIILSIMILAGTLSLMLISINDKLQNFEDKMEAKDRALRVNMESSETKIEESMNELSSKVDNAVYEFNRRKYPSPEMFSKDSVPRNTCIRIVFPDPLFPKIPTTSPSLILKFTFFRALRPSKSTVRFLTSINTGMHFPPQIMSCK